MYQNISRILLAITCMLATVVANGELIVHDPFPTGTLQDAADRIAYVPGISLGHGSGATNRSVGFLDDPWGGEGTWAGHWVRGGPWHVAEGGFDTYVSGGWQIATSGGHVQYSPVQPGDTGGSTHRRLSSSANAYTNDTLYFSFLSHWNNFEGAGASNGYGLGKESPSVTNNDSSWINFQAIGGTGGQQGQFRLRGVAGQTDYTGPLDTQQPYFFVGQYILNSGELIDPGHPGDPGDPDADPPIPPTDPIPPTYEPSEYTFTVWVNPDLALLQSGTLLDNLDEEQFLFKLTTSQTVDTPRPVDFWHMNTGTSTSETYQHLMDELRFGTSQEAVLVIEPISTGPGIPGDITDDGRVDRLDVLALLHNYGRTNVPWFEGDLSGDGKAGLHDLAIVHREFGNEADPPVDTSAVPEPSTLAMLLAGLASLALFRRRR